ncbi:MAG TPA: amino acid adenylation domain-containing protein [Pyrinomonadaceae bacterium]|nr:amino acid adenylation domain-containing protein [Pyrinomonadaceae bacterium]
MQQDVIQGFRLSPQQKRVWSLQETSTAYRAQCAILIEGSLRVEFLQEALLKVVDRHEILRTIFDRLPGMKVPIQRVAAEPEPVWRRIDRADCEAPQVISELEAQERDAVFDFARGPLVRCTLACLGVERHLLFVTLPALCADARSLENLFSEIVATYEAGLEGGAVAKETVQYVQFSEWQNELFETDEAQAGREFWNKQRSAAAARMSLPIENEIPVSTFDTGLWVEAVHAETLSRIQTVAGHQDISTEVLLLACWHTLLWRLTSEPGIEINVRSDGRVYEEMIEAIGLYEKWLPVPCSFDGDFRFDEIVQRVDKSLRESLEWQEYFTREPSLARTTGATTETLEAGFAFEETPEMQSAGSLRFSVAHQSVTTDRFRMKLLGVQTPVSLRLEFHYDSACYGAETVKIIARQYVTLLNTVLLNPKVSIGDVDVISDAERHQVLVEWNQTAVSFPQDVCLPELFEAQVQRTPETTAVVFEGKRLTYRELNRRANQLAHHLRNRGVRAETCVAVCLERSVDMLVAVVGIWKSGGVYLPLDPIQPGARLAFMITDSQAQLIISHRPLESSLPDCGAEVLYLDAASAQIEQESEADPPPVIHPDNLAYVIYTSGSTGQPKGAMVEHRSVVNLAQALQQGIYRDKGSGLRVSLNAPLAFDSSIKQIVQLLAGHTLYVLPEEVRREGEALLAYLEDHKLDVFDCTPSQLRLLVESGWADAHNCPPRILLVGGEALDPDLWQTLAQHETTTTHNVYGPTECTVDATACLVSRKPARPAIGRPLANVQTYVLDHQLKPVPLGVTGELYIGGAGVARGYLRRPDLTAEKFIPHPFSDNVGARLYRTGDLARYGPDGNLEFLGRIDHQVKIRGSRIELGEIEAALATHPAVRTPVVMARESGLGDKRLVAYFVTSGAALSAHELHGFLHECLPEYMMPSAFVPLPALPLLPNGKIDRLALPAPDQVVSSRAADYIAPRSPNEELLAGIWARVLGVERVGMEDNFFELGGHSLLATQVISQIRHALQVEIPLRTIFETPTVGGLADSIRQAQETPASVGPPPLKPVPRDQRLPLSFAQQRLWFLDQLDPGNTAYHIPYALRLEGSLDTEALEESLSELVRRHEVLRTTFSMIEGQAAQVIHPARPLHVTLTDLRQFSEAERETKTKYQLEEETQRLFDLEHGPLLRASLLRLGEREHVLILVMHHIVFDAWSIPVLLHELSALYQACAHDRPSPLPDLPVQYADFAHWQRGWLQGEALAEHLVYWKTQLADLTVLELPTDRPRPPVQTFRGAHQSFSLPDALVRSLYELSRAEGATVFMTLLAAFQTLLHRYTSQVYISVGTPIANRNYRDIEGLIGFFINTLVLRTNLSGDPSFQELLHRVREVALNAYAHQDLPFEKLVEELQPDRDLSRTPFFQVLFTVRNLQQTSFTLPDLTMHGLEVETGTAKLDLLMLVDETEQGINFGIEYNTDLFDDATVARMAKHFVNLLAGITADPQLPISRLPLLTEEERQQLLGEWNSTSHAFPQDECIQTMFERQVARTPDAVAVVFEDQELTYRELNGRANQLAHYLSGLGVGPDTFVGILMHRSLEMIVSVLGILKAGGAYAPLDPAYPEERLAYMLENTRAKVLLSQQHLVQTVPDREIKMVLVDADWGVIGRMSQDNPHPPVTADNLLYVTFTSGSTGKPKGIAMVHRALRNLLEWQFTETDLPAGARTLQFASLSFDVSFQDMFSTWGMGGTLVLITEEMRRDIGALSQVLTDKKIHRLFIPAVALQQLAEGFGSQQLISASLRKVIAGSEQLQITRAIDRLFTELKDCSLHNEYGPSETHVVTNLDLPASVAAWPERPSVGQPIHNSQIYILDTQRQPVPVGVSGELHIGGAGLARGYLNRPDLTADRFIPDPFGGETGARLYRTGDLARWLPAGQIEFLGRMDFQVKIRGFRVELGEIEAVLSNHPAVRETIVLAREDNPGDKRLVAYLVLAQQNQPTISELRSFLHKSLPDYMMPSAFVFLDTLPLTPNGKVNRRALPAPETTRPELERVYVAPRGALEELVTTCWEEVLGLERVGIQDDFFELGGHSLLATQIIGRLREIFPIELPLRTLFESPTVAGLSARIVEQDGTGTVENIASTLKELTGLSEEEIQALLEQERQAETGAP